MSADLKHALADVAAYLDEEAPPISVDELLVAHEAADPSTLIPLTRSHRRRRWPSRVLAFAAAVVLLVVGLVAVAALRDSPTATDQPVQSAPPRPEDLPATGVVFAPEDTLALSAAQDTLIAECMAGRGFEYPLPTTDELIAGFGEWQPHAVLGIQRAGAGRRIGYHSSGVGGFGTVSQGNAISLMDAGQRETFVANAFDGPDSCMSAVQPALGDPLARDEQLRAAVNSTGEIGDMAPSGSGFDDVAIRDPRVEEALATWAACVEAATGEQAETPNELARRFLDGTYDGAATDREITVAPVDAQCQEQAQLWTTWYTVVAELTRARLGADAHLYDGWTRTRVEMVETARSILSERQINLPPLD